MANTIIKVHHAGPGETLGGHPRVKIWCDIKPNLKMKDLFKDVANGIEGIVDIFPSGLEDAHVVLIIDPQVSVEPAVSAWIREVNRRLSPKKRLEKQMLQEQILLPDPDVTAKHSASSAFHGADRSD